MAQSKTGVPGDQTAPSLPRTCVITDRFGNTLRFGNAGSFLVAPMPIGQDNDYWTHYHSIRNMEIRDDDVIIVGFPKTGNHWHNEMLRMLMAGEAKYDDKASPLVLVDMMPQEKLSAMKSPRLLNIHTPFRGFPRQALEKKVKIIFLDRNPKDVFVSFFSHASEITGPMSYPGKFEHFFYMMLETGYYFGDMFSYLLEWQEGLEAYPHIYTSVFEEVKLDPVGAVVKLNEYLGTGLSKEVCEEIAEACSFKKMKEIKNNTAPDEMKKRYKSGERLQFLGKEALEIGKIGLPLK